MEPRQRRFSIWYLVAAMLIWFIAQALSPKSAEKTISYSELKTLVAADKIEDVVIAKDMISGTLSTQGLEGVLPADRIAALGPRSDAVHCSRDREARARGILGNGKTLSGSLS